MALSTELRERGQGARVLYAHELKRDGQRRCLAPVPDFLFAILWSGRLGSLNPSPNMRKYLFLMIGMTLFAACEQKSDVAAPAAPVEKKAETDTTTYRMAARPQAQPPATKSKKQPVEETLTAANIAFNTPESMAYGETTTIHLVLHLSKSEAELAGLVTGRGPVETDRIKVSHVVQATLTGDGFEITPATVNSSQLIDENVETEWKWSVRPKRIRTQELRLSLDAKVQAYGAERTRTVRVLDRSITVRITGFRSGIAAAQDNWPFLAGAGGVVVAVGGWLLKRLRKQPSAESNRGVTDHDQP